MVVSEAFFVGQRVCVSGDVGTVRYVGAVSPAKGEWIGIEWDDQGRGKHNGTKDGITYFTCDSETGGSFVRPHKINKGVTIVDALVERYTSFSCKDGSLPGEDLYFVDPETSQKTMVETVGMGKVQKQFEDLVKLKIAGLRENEISSSGEEGALATQAPNIQELDLSKNLLSHWEAVAEICQQLVKLQQVNLSQNLLKIPPQPALLAPSFQSLQTIIANKCKLKWADVISCLDMWPQVEELHLEANGIGTIAVPDETHFSKLRMLNLSENPIKEWKFVQNLSKIPNLEQLVLNNCSLKELALSAGDFTSMRQIFLTGNDFRTSEVFNQLNNLKNLESLMFRSNPILLEETAETMREIIVAKIGRLKVLNRSDVTEVERQGAEMDYLKKNGKYWRESGGHQDPEKNQPSEQFIRDHPRYNELIKIHGARDDAEFFIKSTALSSSLLEVIITVRDKPEIKPMRRKLPTSMTVGALKMMISRLTKTPIKDQKLVYISHDKPEHIVEMNKDSETLHVLSLENGDIVEVRPRYTDFLEPRISWASRKPPSAHKS